MDRKFDMLQITGKRYFKCKLKYLEAPKQTHLKLVSTIFYQTFIFSSNDSPTKTMKNVFYFI